MSGTPNVETHVIPELMDEYNIKNLYQRIIIDKSYKNKPIVHLTHLDTVESDERQDTVIDQIKTYLKQGRKVCHIFNNKSKMDHYVREIQSKLSNNIKVGLFYSGSSGECTRNILAGKFGKYDVVLATTYFINGINIEKDKLSEEDISNGKTSKQKYGVVIDLGQTHTRVNAMDAIQAINRFRNRLCHTTIFLPKIFKPDLQDSSKSFDFRNAAKVLLGINKYNYHLLSAQKDLDPFEEEEIEKAERLLMLESIRKNPLHVSVNDISKATKEEENRAKVFNMITKKARLYEDWFYSLDGYHYLAKDAGFNSIIKHRSKKYVLNDFDDDHIEVENQIITKFFSNDKVLDYLDQQLDPERRIYLKSSGKIIDPSSDVVDNFKVVDLLNGKYIVEGDFHESHERLLNTLIKMHLNFTYWYGLEKSSDIVRLLLNKDVVMLPNNSKHLGSNLITYQKSCKSSNLTKYSSYYGFILGMHELSKLDNSGVEMSQSDTSSSFSVENHIISDLLKEKWAEYQYDMTLYKIEESDSQDKEDLRDYYSNKGAMMNYDVEELIHNLKSVGLYKKYRMSRKDTNSISSKEQLHIARVYPTDKLKKPSYDLDTSDWVSPEKYTLKDLKGYISDRNKKVQEYVKEVIDKSIVLDPVEGSIVDNKLTSIITSSKYSESKLKHSVEDLISSNFSTVSIHDLLNSILSKINNKSRLYYNVFKYSEYKIYKDCNIHKRIPTLDKLFFMEEDFDLNSLNPNTEEDLKLDKNSEEVKEVVKNLFKSKSGIRNGYTILFAVDKSTEEILVAGSDKASFCKNICKYAFQNKEFILPTGIPVKKWGSGLYNHSTFRRNYLYPIEPSKKLINYIITEVSYTVEEIKEVLKN